MFKKFTLVLLCAFFFQFESKAQFSFDDDSLHASNFAANASNPFVDIYGHTVMRNPSKTHPDTVVWERILEDLPTSKWSSAVCDINLCHGTSTSTAEFILDTNTSREVSFHFYPDVDKGYGKMKVRFAYKSNPSYYIDVVTTVQAFGASISAPKKAAFSIAPNPATTTFTITAFNSSEGSFKIVNILGETVMTGDFANGQPIDITSLSKGVYCVTVVSNNVVTASKLVVE